MKVFEHPLALILRSSKLIERKVEAHIEKTCAMKRSHARLLFIVSVHPGLSQVALREMIGISAPVMSRQIDDMVALGYVTRTVDPDNRRVHTISLTKKGIRKSESVGYELQAAFDKISESIPHNIDSITKHLQQVVVSLGEGPKQ